MRSNADLRTSPRPLYCSQPVFEHQPSVSAARGETFGETWSDWVAHGGVEQRSPRVPLSAFRPRPEPPTGEPRTGRRSSSFSSSSLPVCPRYARGAGLALLRVVPTKNTTRRLTPESHREQSSRTSHSWRHYANNSAAAFVVRHLPVLSAIVGRLLLDRFHHIYRSVLGLPYRRAA